MLRKKVAGGAIACAMMLNCTLISPFGTVAAGEVYEFENGTLSGNAVVKNEGTGFSGDGYVFLEKSGDTAAVTVDVPESGSYNIVIGYQGAYGSKIQTLEINGVTQGSVSFQEGTAFDTVKFGPVGLEKGENTVSIVGDWGWVNLDYIMLESAQLAELTRSNALSDKSASSETQGLMNYLATVYGEYVVSGQQEIYGGGNNENYEYEMEYLYETTGRYPAIRGFDYMNVTNPAYGWDDKTTERIIEWVNERGGIATASWHITVPTDFTSYELGSSIQWDAATYGVNSNFVTKNALDPETKEYKYFRQCVENLAAELKQLQDAGVPIILRPFHEAEGNGGEKGSWFWWGKDGSAVYKALWKQLYETLTDEFGLHNIIWEFNSYTFATSRDWYPGDDYVDLIGFDKYNASAGNPNEAAIGSTFYSLVDMYSAAGKMISMAECDTIPSVENMKNSQAYWLYFCPWYEDSTGEDKSKFLSQYNNKETLKATYNSDLVITLDELPDYKTYEYTGEPFIPEPTDPPVPTDPPTEVKEGHAEFSKDPMTGNIIISFPEPVGDACYLVVDLADGMNYANGCLGATVELDGKYYWVSVQWETTKSGAVKVDMSNVYNVTLDKDVVEDEDIIEKVTANIAGIKEFQVQVWYVGDEEGESAATSNAKITDAYLLTAAGEDPTDSPETDTDTPISDIKYGDANDDGEIDIADVIDLCKAAMGTYSLSENGARNADVDLDGKATTTDASYILQSLVGLTELPVTK